jgi:hypothetical protein
MRSGGVSKLYLRSNGTATAEGAALHAKLMRALVAKRKVQMRGGR